MGVVLNHTLLLLLYIMGVVSWVIIGYVERCGVWFSACMVQEAKLVVNFSYMANMATS